MKVLAQRVFRTFLAHPVGKITITHIVHNSLKYSFEFVPHLLQYHLGSVLLDVFPCLEGQFCSWPPGSGRATGEGGKRHAIISLGGR